jgi:hypothetical protein
MLAWEVTKRTVVDAMTDKQTANHVSILKGWIGTVHPGSNFGFGNTVVRDVLKYTELKHTQLCELRGFQVVKVQMYNRCTTTLTNMCTYSCQYRGEVLYFIKFKFIIIVCSYVSRLGPLACCESKSASQTMEPFRAFTGLVGWGTGSLQVLYLSRRNACCGRNSKPRSRCWSDPWPYGALRPAVMTFTWFNLSAKCYLNTWTVFSVVCRCFGYFRFHRTQYLHHHMNGCKVYMLTM